MLSAQHHLVALGLFMKHVSTAGFYVSCILFAAETEAGAGAGAGLSVTCA